MARKTSDQTTTTTAADTLAQAIESTIAPQADASVERGYLDASGNFTSEFAENITGGALRIGTEVIGIAFSAVSPKVAAWLMAQGIRHTLGDATANAKTIAEEEGETRNKAQIAAALAGKKASTLLAGEVVSRGDAGVGLGVDDSFDAAWIVGYSRALTAAGKPTTPAEAAAQVRAAIEPMPDQNRKTLLAQLRANTAVRNARDAYIEERRAARGTTKKTKDGDVTSLLQIGLVV